MDKENYTELLPPAEDEQAVADAVIVLAEETITYKQDRGLLENWVENYELGRHEHYINDKKTQGIDYASVNMLHKNRQECVNMLTDNNPTFDITIAGRGDFKEQKKIIGLSTEQWWRETEQQDCFADSVHNGETYGNAVEMVYFDSEEDGGEVMVSVYDSFYYSPYPPSSKKNPQKASGHIFFDVMSVKEAKRKWPEKASEIVSDAEFAEKLGDDREEKSVGKGKKTRVTSYSSTLMKLFKSFGSDMEPSQDTGVLITMWVKDYTPATTKDGKAEVNGLGEQQYKYTGKLRCVRVWSGGAVLIDDRDNPSINPNLNPELAAQTYVYDKFPVATAQSLRDPSCFFAQSDFDQLKGLNKSANANLTKYNQILKKIARILGINPLTSGVPNEHFNEYEAILKPLNSKEAAGLGWLQPPPMPNGLPEAVQLFIHLFFQMAGSNDFDQAVSGGKGVVAYKALAAMLENAARRLRDKDRSYNKLIRDRGRIALGLMQNWYKDKWITDKTRDDEGLSISGEQLIIPFRLSVVSGSTMPVSKVQRRDEAIALNKQGQLPTKFLLEILEYDDVDEIVQYLERGPIGEVLQKLSAVMPQQAMQQIAQIAQMDMKEFKKLFEAGKIPPIDLRQQPNQMAEIGKRLELDSKAAENRKVNTESNLKAQEANLKAQEAVLKEAQAATEQQKAQTERFKQFQILAGIELDKEAQKIDRARLVADINKGMEVDTENAKGDTRLGAYSEKGMKSNNVQ